MLNKDQAAVIARVAGMKRSQVDDVVWEHGKPGWELKTLDDMRANEIETVTALLTAAGVDVHISQAEAQRLADAAGSRWSSEFYTATELRRASPATDLLKDC